MTDRINSLTVVLGKDIREDDVQVLINAILLMTPVIGVEKNVADPVSYTAETRAKYELRTKLWEVLK